MSAHPDFPRCNRIVERPRSCWWSKAGLCRRVGSCREPVRPLPPRPLPTGKATVEVDLGMLDRRIAWSGVASALLGVALVGGHAIHSILQGVQP